MLSETKSAEALGGGGKKLLIFLGILIFALLPASNTFAYFEGGGLQIYVRAEVSKDNGATWYNFSADTNPGGQTLTVSPGDTLLFRGKVWNEGPGFAVDLTFATNITNSQFLDVSTAFYQADEDGHGTEFTGDPNTGTVSLAQVQGGGSENDSTKYESGTFQITVKKDASIPDNTEMIGTFALSGGTEAAWRLIPKAFAQEFQTAQSTVRILVSNPPAPLPATGPSQTEQFLTQYWWIILLIIFCPLLWKEIVHLKRKI